MLKGRHGLRALLARWPATNARRDVAMEAASQESRSLVTKRAGALLAGLTDEEAAARRARGEGNVAPPATGRSYWQILRENLFTFVNITLFGLGFALALLGRWLDAVVSTCVILT